MAGHSKWANIKHKKERTDAQRGKIFTKIGREIAVAVKEGGGSDLGNNSKLRDVVAKAKAANMPNDNIARSIKKAAGELGSVNYEEIVYEGYGPGGIAVIVETLTDNRNRTAGEMRHLFDKYGGSMGTSGCVAWMFETKGVIIVEKGDVADEDELMLFALDNGADDFEDMEEYYEISCDPASFSSLREALESQGYSLFSAEVGRISSNNAEASSEETEKFAVLLDKLEDQDDVQNVYHNAQVDE
ncbi:MAG: YebC/PmpR family DNA-binding transcriptional regulator [Christensenellales bacterium]